MPFDIEQFRSALAKHGGVDHSSKFDVVITPPQGLLGNSLVGDLSYIIDVASLPGIGIQTEEFQHNGYGITEKRPTNILFDTFAIAIHVDANLDVVDFFHKWIRLINGFGLEAESSTRDKFAYPEEYWSTVTVTKYDISGKAVRKWELQQAFPITISAVEVSWETTNQVSKLPVTFSYHSWKSYAIT